MTRFRSAKNFWTRTVTSAMRIAVNSPFDPRPSIRKVPFAGSIWSIRKTTVAIDALDDRFLLQALAEVVGDRKAREHREQAERRRDRDLQERRDTGATRASQPATGRCATIMKSPPMIVSGTIATIPARMAER